MASTLPAYSAEYLGAFDDFRGSNVPTARRIRRRRLSTHETTSTIAIGVTTVSFNTRGRPSEEVEGGVTSIKIKDSVDGKVSVGLDARTR